MILTCEHGGNRIPREFKTYFESAGRALASHRGLDIGALTLARLLSRKLETPLHYSETSRLLIDLNRSLGHENSFSKYSRKLSESERERVVNLHYLPYRREVERAIQKQKRFCLHVSIHSFTPILNGEKRNCEIGILFDPKRKSELDFATKLRDLLSVLLPHLRVRFNYPYNGTSDGFPTTLRKSRPASSYAGIELEIRQDLLKKMITRKTIADFSNLLAIAIEGARAETN
ncbi:MAG: N-formylglutamate amidohydrolase [Bdellovibrionota bacterium]